MPPTTTIPSASTSVSPRPFTIAIAALLLACIAAAEPETAVREAAVEMGRALEAGDWPRFKNCLATDEPTLARLEREFASRMALRDLLAAIDQQFGEPGKAFTAKVLGAWHIERLYVPDRLARGRIEIAGRNADVFEPFGPKGEGAFHRFRNEDGRWKWTHRIIDAGTPVPDEWLSRPNVAASISTIAGAIRDKQLNTLDDVDALVWRLARQSGAKLDSRQRVAALGERSRELGPEEVFSMLGLPHVQTRFPEDQPIARLLDENFYERQMIATARLSAPELRLSPSQARKLEEFLSNNDHDRAAYHESHPDDTTAIEEAYRQQDLAKGLADPAKLLFCFADHEQFCRDIMKLHRQCRREIADALEPQQRLRWHAAILRPIATTLTEFAHLPPGRQFDLDAALENAATRIDALPEARPWSQVQQILADCLIEAWLPKIKLSTTRPTDPVPSNPSIPTRNLLPNNK